jgi:hypothetical protein
VVTWIQIMGEVRRLDDKRKCGETSAKTMPPGS